MIEPGRLGDETCGQKMAVGLVLEIKPRDQDTQPDESVDTRSDPSKKL